MTDAARVWFTADQHFGHANVIKHSQRPFSSIEEMDATLIKNWNRCVKKGDDVFHLGDFAWRHRSPCRTRGFWRLTITLAPKSEAENEKVVALAVQ